MPESVSLKRPKGRHPLIHAGRFLLSDLLSTLAFVALYAATQSIYLATFCAIALGLGQIACLRMSGATIDLMQWLSLGLVIVFGGATLLTRNPVFILLKPSLIYAAIGIVMLRPGWMNRSAPPAAVERAGDVIRLFGFVWSGLFFATAAINALLAAYATPTVWAWFIGVFPIVSKAVLVLVQYATTRFVVRRRSTALSAA